jgi:hypothetical protein
MLHARPPRHAATPAPAPPLSRSLRALPRAAAPSRLRAVRRVLAQFQEAFLLTPYQMAKHWQPLILGLIALGHHIRIVPNWTWRAYSTWQTAAIFHVLLAFFGCAGWAGNIGIIAACLCLVTAFLATCMSCLDRDGRGGSLSEPLFG